MRWVPRRDAARRGALLWNAAQAGGRTHCGLCGPECLAELVPDAAPPAAALGTPRIGRPPPASGPGALRGAPEPSRAACRTGERFLVLP